MQWSGSSDYKFEKTFRTLNTSYRFYFQNKYTFSTNKTGIIFVYFINNNYGIFE